MTKEQLLHLAATKLLGEAVSGRFSTYSTVYDEAREECGLDKDASLDDVLDRVKVTIEFTEKVEVKL